MQSTSDRQCWHNPSASSSSFARFWGFVFQRKKHLNDYSCSVCGAPLQIPRIYSSLVWPIGFLLLYLIVCFIVIHNIVFDVIPSCLLVPVIFAFCAVAYIAVRLLTAAFLTFGQWHPSDIPDNHLLQAKKMTALNYQYCASVYGAIYIPLGIYTDLLSPGLLAMGITALISGCTTRKIGWIIGGSVTTVYVFLSAVLIPIANSAVWNWVNGALLFLAFIFLIVISNHNAATLQDKK